MARTRSLSWKTLFVICFVILCILLLYGNSLFVWRQTTIMITTNSPNVPYISQNENDKSDSNIINNNNNSDTPSLETSLKSENISNSNNRTQITNYTQTETDHTVYLHKPITNYAELQKHYNLHSNPYENVAQNTYLSFLSKEDYLQFSECISSIDKDSREGKCALSKQISFEIHDIIGSGNHGKILSVNIEINMDKSDGDTLENKHLPLHVEIERMNSVKYALKYSSDNETCDTLRFEYQIMKTIQSAQNMNAYYLTSLHALIPWIEWVESNRFTRKTEAKCVLIMEQIENVKTFEGVIQKSYPPSFEFDNGLVPFLVRCYNELMIGLERLHLFNYFHIDINGVNILVWPRKNIVAPRVCYLIDYGGIFAMNFDANTHKLFTGKSHTYSPFAYYNLYTYEQRDSATEMNLTKLNALAIKDNQYRVCAELLRFYLEYVALDSERIAFSESEYGRIEIAQNRQNRLEHVWPVGINEKNETYMRLIWCLRQVEINQIKQTNLGSEGEAVVYSQKQKNEFLKLLRIVNDAHKETNAINEKLCNHIMKKEFA